jgi:very-short-patch-repair endonuclease
MPDGVHRGVPPAKLALIRSMRREMSPVERVLWQRLRDRQAEFKFRRQHPIGRYIVDFYCDACRLVVEVDGASHDEQIEYDTARTAWLTARGYRVIRFTNEDVLHRTDAVLSTIVDECERAIGGESGG